MNRRTLLLAGLVAVGLVALGLQRRWFDPVLQPALTAAFPTSTPREPTRIFVVLDTVRADRLSVCGYDRPTSPVLERVVASGATVRCGGVAPSPWTLPSHASYFTGTLVPEHRADFVAESGIALNGIPVNALGPNLPTLAEDLEERGFQTAAVSGNLVVGPATGLVRGFRHARTPSSGYFRGDLLIDALRGVLRYDVARDGTPLFLFVNIIDAHQPYPAIPSGLDWVPPRDGIVFDFTDPADPWQQFITGAMPEAQRGPFLEHLGDVYDYGVWEADAVLGRVLDELDAHGWLEGGYQLVITSDHGEYLGEHGLLEHGAYLWEPVINVPLIVHDTRGNPDLPERVAALEAYHLLRDGAPAGLPVLATAQANPEWTERSKGKVGDVTTAGAWNGSQKDVWMNGTTTRFDLDRDPRELQGTAIEPSPTLEALAGALERNSEGQATDQMLEMLKSVGYLDD